MWREGEEVQDLAYIIIKVIDDEVGDEGMEMHHQRLHIISKGFPGFMMLFKAKTGKYIHVNYWGIINWTPICTLKHPCESLNHRPTIKACYWSLPADYHHSITVQLLAQLNWVVSLLQKQCDDKSAAKTSISSHLQKKEGVQALCKTSQHSQNICLPLQQRAAEEIVGVPQDYVWTDVEIFLLAIQKKRELPFEISICIWKERKKTGALNWFQHECLIILSPSLCPFLYRFRLKHSVRHEHIQMKSHMKHKPYCRKKKTQTIQHESAET